ncbi:MAG: riboflavin biosynthesis protein RibF [Candidatus Omnitrophica bacterium]|nr:riboflavin biosynthesis protein RibF [Candidatus Omnitrophota bacterium]
MKVINGTRSITGLTLPVVALGVFDGLHRAHREILRETVRLARKGKGTGVVVTFWPHPQKQQSVYSLQHRLKLIAASGIDACVVIRFDKRFAQMPARDFVRDILAGRLHARALCVGRNFRFGKNASGDWRLLVRLGELYGFKVKVFDVIKDRGHTVSSTLIRRLILAGKLRAAEKLLGRPVTILGTVVRGRSIGKTLGFPTANINPHHEVLPPSGIYAVSAKVGRKKFGGARYIGTRPTFRKKENRSLSRQIEVHLFGLHPDLYGQDMEIRFLKKIRPDRRFSSVAKLVLNIKKDIIAAKKIISRH